MMQASIVVEDWIKPLAGLISVMPSGPKTWNYPVPYERFASIPVRNEQTDIVLKSS